MVYLTNINTSGGVKLVRLMISLDEGIKDAVAPLLKRDGLTISSYTRKCLNDYLDAHNARNQVISIADLDALDDIEARR